MSRARVTVPQIQRMVELHDAGLSYGAIAAVVNLDHGLALTDHSVRHYVRDVAKRPGRLRGGGESVGLAGGGVRGFGRREVVA